MVIDLTAIGDTVAWIGCAAMLVFWLTIGKRRLSSFLYVVTGWGILIAGVHSDQKPGTLAGICLAGAFGCGLLTVAYRLLRARRLANRRRVVYKPSAD